MRLISICAASAVLSAFFICSAAYADQVQSDSSSSAGVKSGSIVPTPSTGSGIVEVTMPDGLVDPRDSNRTFKAHRGTEVYKLPIWSVTWRGVDGNPQSEIIWSVIEVQKTSTGVTVVAKGQTKTFPADAEVTRANGYTLLLFAPGEVRSAYVEGLRPIYIVP